MEILLAFLVGIGVLTGYEDLKPEDETEPVFVVMMQDRPCDFEGEIRVADLSVPQEKRIYMSSKGVCSDEEKYVE